MEILKIENLTKVYGKGENEVHALNGVSFSVEKGEFVSIIGSSGSGKSTLLHLIGGVDRPTSGKVYVDGKDVYAQKEEALAIFRRRQVGLIYQFYNLIPVLNVEENMTLPVLMEIVRTDSKQRYGLKRQGEELMIRCNQGHSIPWLEMDYKVETPPEILYHGTGFAALDAILKEGLRPMTRQKVHLSRDTAAARQVARRWKNHGAPVILQIDAGDMARDGYVFYLSENEIWLTDHVPPKYLSVLCVEG